MSAKDLELYDYFEHRLGADTPTVNTFLKTLTEYIALKTSSGAEANVKMLGSFKHKEGQYTVSFECTRSLRILMQDCLEAKPLRKKNLKNEFDRQREAKNLNDKIIGTIRGSVDSDRRNNSLDQVRLSLVQYLQYNYALDYRWAHPFTNRHFKAEEVRTAAMIIRKLNERDYALLLTLWSGIDVRRSLLEKWGYDKKQYWQHLERVLDAILVLLTAPRLSEQQILSILGLADQPPT